MNEATSAPPLGAGDILRSLDVGVFFRHRLMAAVSVLFALSALPSFVRILSPDLTWSWAENYADAPVMLVVLGAAVWLARREEGRARPWWWAVAGMHTAWLAVRLVYLLVPLERWGVGADLATDLLYLTGYLFLALALEYGPDPGPAGKDAQGGRRVESVGTLLFAFFTLSYFILAPSVFTPDIWETWVTSLFLYGVLDLYLGVHALRWLRKPGLAERWRAPLAWFALTGLLWFVGDTLEGLMYLEVVPYVDSGTPLDLIWLLPSLTFAASACSAVSPGRREVPGEPGTHRKEGTWARDATHRERAVRAAP